MNFLQLRQYKIQSSTVVILLTVSCSDFEGVEWIPSCVSSLTLIVFLEYEGISRSYKGIVNPGGYTINLDGRATYCTFHLSFSDPRQCFLM